ncbi:MAG: SGNH/GDSL hydrolase family protein [Gemmatales bacterium]
MRFCLILILCTPATVCAQSKAPAKENPVFARIEDVPGRPRVLLIGDSISMDYTLYVRKLLAGQATVHRIPENGGPTSNGIAKLDQWLTMNGNSKWDVIHFNWGLHDLKITKQGHQVSPEQYESNLRMLVRKLKSTGAKLIWASTTPVPPGVTNPPRKSEDVLVYNDIAVKIMKAEGIAINDLYSATLPNLKSWQKTMNVHFHPVGSQGQAEVVASAIRNALSPDKK